MQLLTMNNTNYIMGGKNSTNRSTSSYPGAAASTVSATQARMGFPATVVSTPPLVGPGAPGRSNVVQGQPVAVGTVAAAPSSSAVKSAGPGASQADVMRSFAMFNQVGAEEGGGGREAASVSLHSTSSASSDIDAEDGRPDVGSGSSDAAPKKKKRRNKKVGAAATAAGPPPPSRELFVCGSNEDQRLGHEVAEAAVGAPRPVPELRIYDIKAVECGDAHTVAVGADGQLVTFGANGDGQLGRSPNLDVGAATLPRALRGTRILSVSCGTGFTLAVADGGRLLASGLNSHGQLGKGDRKSCHEFKLVPFFKKGGLHVVSVSAGGRHALALTANGDSFGWGDNSRGQVGCGGAATHLTAPERVEALWGLPLVQLLAGDQHSLALTASGNVYAWGDNTAGQLALGPSGQGVPDRVPEPCWVHAFRGAGVVRVAAGSTHGAALTSDGVLYMWGHRSARTRLMGSLGLALGGGDKDADPAAATVEGPSRIALPAGERCTLVACGHTLTVAATNAGRVAYSGMVPASVTDAKEGVPVDGVFSLPTGSAAHAISCGSSHFVLTACARGSCSLGPCTDADSHNVCQTPLPFVSERLLKRASEAAKSDSKALPALCSWIEGVFSCASSLNQSFLSDNARRPQPPTPNDSESEFRARVNVDLDALRRTYIHLWSLRQPSIEKAMLNGFARLAAAVLARRRNVVQPELLRMFLIALESPALLNANAEKAPVLGAVLQAILSLPDPLKDLLFNVLARYPPDFFLMPLNVLQRYVTHLLVSQTRPNAALTAACVLLQQLATRNDVLHVVPLASFYNVTAITLLERSPESEYWLWRQRGDSLCQYPFLLSANAKSLVLKADAHAQMKQQIENSLFASVMSGTMNIPFLVLSVRRDHVVADALQQLMGRPQAELKKPLKVKFVGEEGIDAGGVAKEFFQLVVGQLFDVRYGMFVFDPDTRACWFNAASLDQGSEFRLVGLVLGLAIYNSVILDLRFPAVVYKKLLGMEPSIADLADTQPMTARSLQQMLTYPADQFDDAFGDDFDFTANVQFFDTTTVVDLCEGGADRAVTADNREEYVRLYVQHLLVDSVREQFEPFRDGFLSVAGGPVLRLFNPAEVELLACGNKELNMQELESVASYAGGFSPKHKTVRNFWAVVRSMSMADQRKLLAFATGSDRVPINGLKSMKFILHMMGTDEEHLPASATCFNTVYLPAYTTRKQLEIKLRLAIKEGLGFGLQ